MKGPGRINGIEDEGRALVERLGGRWTKRGGLCRCPAHDDRKPSLSVRPGRTRILLHCFAGCSAEDILQVLEANGLLMPAAAGAEAVAPGQSDSYSITAAVRIWAASRSIPGTAAASYLQDRGIHCFSSELRFNARTPHGAVPLTRYRPALVAAVRDDCGFVGIHRTFLDCRNSCGTPAKDRRAGLGRLGSGAVRLGGIGSRLGLAEGIETALSVSELFGIKCWSTLGTERFGLVSIPSEVEELHLFLDHDDGGRRAELLARENFTHLPIKVHIPEREGDDFNDVLRRRVLGESWGD